MINTPAGFGRALNFGNPAGFPVWRAGEGFEFPNAIGWSAIYQTGFINIPPDVAYGPPFITGHTRIKPLLAFYSKIQPVISRQSGIEEDS